jgi:hypothetical protein
MAETADQGLMLSTRGRMVALHWFLDGYSGEVKGAVKGVLTAKEIRSYSTLIELKAFAQKIDFARSPRPTCK